MARFPIWHDSRPGFRIREAAPMLFIGGWHAANAGPGRCTTLSGRKLQRARWGGMLSMSRDRPVLPNIDPMLSDSWLVRPMRDGTGIEPMVLDEAVVLYERCLEARMPLLVHCAAGLSRSASAVYGLLRFVHRMPHDDALRRVRVHSVDTPYPLQATLDSARRWAEARIDRID